jgi:transcription elongation factor Elf1
MMLLAPKSVISKERAERIAKGHACEHCGEYSYKKLAIKPPTATQRSELKESWHAIKTCGVCGLEQEMGIDADGDILYVN